MHYDLVHLKDWGEKVFGPVQSDEALFLYALVQVLRPNLILEFGLSCGDSTRNFLAAMSSSCQLYSYDITDYARKNANMIDDERFTFLFKGQEMFAPEDISDEAIDLVLFDASHDPDLNMLTFEKIKDHLSKNCVLFVHDTGAWNNDFNEKPEDPSKFYMNGRCFEGGLLESGGFAHQKGEREFVNRLRERYPEFHQIHLHSEHTLRHGSTLLQRSEKLDV